MQPESKSPKHQQDSSLALAACLLKLLEDEGGKTTQVDLLVALGASLSLFYIQSTDEESPIPAECHDMALKEAADLFGIRLRELHPPRARYRLGHSAEFSGHFNDSYVPLIRRALEHGQSVLALGGWPVQSGATWGLILPDRCDDGSLYGMAGGDGDPLPLVEPALQCYMIENVDPVSPTAEDALLCGARAVVRLIEDGSQAYPGLVPACRLLSECVGSPGCDTTTESTPIVHEIVQVLGSRHRITARFLSEHVESMSPEIRKHAKDLLHLCDKYASATEALAGKGQPASRDWLQELIRQDGGILTILEATSLVLRSDA